MKKIKKLLSVILVATMVFTTLSMGISVSAENLTTETTETSDSPLEIEVTTDKSNYGKFGVAEITVTVTNTSDETVENISAEAIFDDLAPVDSLYSETSKKVEALEPGKNFSFSYKAMLNYKSSNVGFFSKIILWFVWLFNDGYTVVNGSSEGNIENVTEIKFGKVSADNKIKVWYELHNNFTEPNYDDIEIVDISLEYINSDEFKNLDIEEKKETVNNTLNDLADKGYITQDSIHYNDDLKYFYYEYSSANWENYIFLELNEEHTQTTEDVGLRDFFTDIRSKARLNSSKTVFNNESFSLKSINSQSTEIPKNSGNAVIMYGLDSCGDISKDKNLNNDYLSFLNGQANNWNNMNLVTTLYTDTTVALYKTALKNKNLIVIEEHGVEYGDKEYNKVSFILKEKTSKSKDKNDYSYDLDEKHICRINGRYAINPSFFSHYYKNQLKNSIIYFASCRGLGHSGVENYRFSEAFDAKCTLGFHNNVRVNYQMNMMSYFVGNLTYGRTTKFSLDYAINVLGEYGPNGEYAIITSYYSTLYEQNEISGSVKDEITSSAISGVTIEIIDNNFYNSNTIATATTDENGLFSVKLPYGSYSMSFNHDNYEYYSTTINVDTENVVLTEPVLLTPKNSSGGNVEVAKFLGKDISEVIKEYGNSYVEESIEGGHYYVYNNLGFGITENAYAGLEPKNVVSISAVTTNVKLYQDFSSNMSYNDLVKLVPDIEKPEYLYNESTDEFMYYTTFTYENYLFVYVWNKYLSDDDICYQAHVMFNPNYEERTIVDSGFCGADGDNVTYTLYDDGELVISGSGKMMNYSSSSKVPWCSVRESITKVTIKSGVTSISDCAFNACTNLENITLCSSIKEIGYGCFAACYKLSKITIPASVNQIGYMAFYGCPLKYINVDVNNKFYTNDAYGVLYNYDKTILVQYPNRSNYSAYSIPTGTIKISDYAFMGSVNLNEVVIPYTVTEIGNGAFYSCTNINKFELSDSITHIGELAFGNCINLQSIMIPNNITSIESSTFELCKNLTSITIPNSVIEIKDDVFYSCDNLSHIYYKGTESEWNSIVINSDNEEIANATIHYNS